MKHLQVLLVVCTAIFLLSCGGGKPSVTITLTPATATVATSQNYQFTATVTNGSTTAVNWQVNGLLFGNSASVGTINAGGLYTAPSQVPNPATVTITAIPLADTTKSASATVTVTLGANLSISPSSPTLTAGAQQTFLVNSNGSPATGVVFTLSCKSSTPGACGTITSAGIYTAPLSPPPGGNVIITATLMDSGATFATSATVTIQASTQSFLGQYAFSASGQSASGAYNAAGTVTFDGNGNVTAGVVDVNKAGTVTTEHVAAGSTYSFSPSDGRVKVTLQTDQGSDTWYLVLASHTHGFVEIAGNGVSASGPMDLQDASQFTAAALNGNYVFHVAGRDSSAKMMAEVGAFTAAAGTVSAGLLDVNDGGALSSNQSVTGSLTVATDATGRGQLSLSSGFGTQTFAAYVVDGTHLKLVETDGNRSLSGEVVQQSAGPFTSFHGSLIVLLNGTSSHGNLGIGGTVNFGNGTMTGGALDQNDATTFTGGNAVAGGNYTLADATTGRTTGTVTLTAGTLPFVLYPINATSYYLLETDSAQITSGPALVGASNTGSNGAIQGNYGVNLSGLAASSQQDIVGSINANGGGVMTGTLDITNGGAATVLQSSPYAVGSTSLATLKSGFSGLSSVGFNLYIVDSTEVLFLENDNKGVQTGIMQLQN